MSGNWMAGRGYSTYSAPAKAVSMEKIVRPFVTVVSKLPEPPKPPTIIALPGSDSEAFLLIGQDAAFSIEGGDAPAEDVNADYYGSVQVGGSGSGGVGTTGLGETVAAGALKTPARKQVQDQTPGVISCQEIDRQVDSVWVYNPVDAEQKVKVQRVLSIRFRIRGGPFGAGAILKLNCKPPPPPPKPKEPDSSGSGILAP